MIRLNSIAVRIAAGVVAAALIAAFAYWLGSRQAGPGTGPGNAEGKPEILYWYDPMVPDTHFDKPGKSPFMDMQLVPKYAAGAGADDADIVRVPAATLQNLGVRTARVEPGHLSAEITVPGSIAWDLRLAHTVSARTDGVIARLLVRAPYEPVQAGQPLAEVLAPEWSAAAQEYLTLGRAESADARALRAAARNRLLVLGMDEAQIRSLGSGNPRLLLRAPVDGVVGTLDVREGQRVQAGMPLLTITGLDSVWLEAAIPQAQAEGIGPGTPAKVSVSALPGETFEGHVEALLPDIDAATRTQRARVVLDNPAHRLAPGMYAEVTFSGAAGPAHPLLPDEALITTGADARVIVAEGEGRFRPVRVTTGRSAGGRTEILHGLHGGERVVVSGQFMIDSEASLSGALERLSPPTDAAHAESHDQHMHMPADTPAEGKGHSNADAPATHADHVHEPAPPAHDGAHPPPAHAPEETSGHDHPQGSGP